MKLFSLALIGSFLYFANPVVAQKPINKMATPKEKPATKPAEKHSPNDGHDHSKDKHSENDGHDHSKDAKATKPKKEKKTGK